MTLTLDPRHVVLASMAIVAIVLWYGLFGPLSPLPPLLRGTRVSTNMVEICPAHDDSSSYRYATSPELETRLSGQFPQGTDEQVLVTALRSQGFQAPMQSCPNDSTIRHSVFPQQTGGGLLRIAKSAIVFWKVDASRKIIWTHGDVHHEGL